MPDKYETTEEMCNKLDLHPTGRKQQAQNNTSKLLHAEVMPSRCIPERSLDSSQPSDTVSQQVATITPPTSSPPSRCIPDYNQDSSQASITVSQGGTQPSRCIPEHSLDSSQPSGTVSQQVARVTPPTSSPPSRCIPD